MEKQDTEVYSLGPCGHDSPLRIPRFISEGARVVADVEYERIEKSFRENGMALSFENAGPRKKIFFDPKKTKAAIVTCGGLCPGLNNVIKGLVENLYYQYGVTDIVGVPFGYEGLIPSYGHGFIPLTPDRLGDIHEKGGSILGSSRGMQDIPAMVDTLEREGISILFTVGGDGTFHGSKELFEETRRRKLPVSIAGIPKTIDNDINFVDRTFGFSTAVSIATMALKGAHAEATGARNGIGLVKVMGRDSGFIAAYTALASNVANYVLIREVPFTLDGPGGLLEHLHRRLEEHRHAVILVAEGAGQEFLGGGKGTDASGNVKYGDIGLYLKDRITGYFKEKKYHANLKYIDPSYIIRSMPASADDAVFCIMLAQNAVHGAMAGRSGFMVGRWANYFTFMPLAVAIQKRKVIEHDGYLWSIVREATGQPDFI
jgi:6-phosphofructokinase 1